MTFRSTTSLSPADDLDGGQSHGQWLLYDGDCPFCTLYVPYARILDAVGPVRVINARDRGPELAEVYAAGLTLDEGMVLKLGGQLYHGDACVHMLAVLTSEVNAFNRLNAWVFRSPRRARILYPLMRAGRNAALRLMGRGKLGQSAAGMPPSGSGTDSTT